MRLTRIEHEEGLAAAGPPVELYAKLEGFNPGGSVKDRAALQIVLDALQSGRLRNGACLLDSTSGNTGVAYAWIGAALGIPVTLVMPENVSSARKEMCRAHGAEVIFSDPLEGSDGAIRLARTLAKDHPDRLLYVDQYANESNPRAHYEGTGREIWEATRGRVTHFVAGIGTSGTLMGTGRRLHQENPRVRVIGVQPDDAFHGLEGLKHLASSIVPAIYRAQEVDETAFVSTDEGWMLAERLGRMGLLVGHSSGGALVGALRVARGLRERGEGGVVVTIFPDRAERYIEPQASRGGLR
jgi:cysteine synthase B